MIVLSSILFTIKVLTKEYYGLQTSMEKRVVELESALADKNAKLEAYEKLEQDLDSVVMQAAEGEPAYLLMEILDFLPSHVIENTTEH